MYPQEVEKSVGKMEVLPRDPGTGACSFIQVLTKQRLQGTQQGMGMERSRRNSIGTLRRQGGNAVSVHQCLLSDHCVLVTVLDGH